MQRRKSARSNRSTAKRGSAPLKVSLAKKMEKEFKSSPNKISAQFKTELAALKQQQGKLQNAFKKAQLQNKVAQKKLAVLANAKVSTTTKKQILAVKKADAKIAKTLKDLTTQIDRIKKQAHALSAKQAKFTALSKQMGQLDKQLTRDAKQQKVVTKPKATPTRKRATKNPTAEQPTPSSPFVPESNTRTSESPVIISTTDEMVEIN